MSDSTKAPRTHSPDHRSTSITLRESLHGHDASHPLEWLPLRRPSSMFPDALPRGQTVAKRDREIYWRLDLRRYSMPMGRLSRDCLGQWRTFRKSYRVSFLEVPYQPHSHLGLQLASQWPSRTIPLRLQTSLTQVSRWRRFTLVPVFRVSALVRTYYHKEMHGLLAILRSHRRKPDPPPRYRRSNIPTTPANAASLDHRPHHSTRHSSSETRRRPTEASLSSHGIPTTECPSLRERPPSDNQGLQLHSRNPGSHA